MTFCNRAEAGRRLTEQLRAWRSDPPIVVALAPRGVPLAVGVAAALHTPLDAVLVHELSVPGCPPGTLGAVGEDGVTEINTYLAGRLGVGLARVDQEARRAAELILHAQRSLRELVPEESVAGRTVILVDDGVATGAAASVAVTVLRKRGVSRLVLAVPVGARSVLGRLRTTVDALVCVREMPWPRPVGEWYEDYPDVTDEEARELLVRAARYHASDPFPSFAATAHSMSCGALV
ncbi:MAG TPA: phosphoribosyltransferase family protein [Actinocrinis sp.]|jgi:putative phosphoribosyl transferase|uniref:phosphoribosyltransferase n=1 Tax=Actinocrinis sp. TaxID=1920516 RepID=UPI002DDD98D2|nr:phosphoribosyltransferase family protein [Actinocrinis sp.]HEV3173875.1 phosphoribosyltransferase family protein [Actinocrinis sp.]